MAERSYNVGDVAVNPDDGRAMYLTSDGEWSPARTAVNPQTKEMLIYNGSEWKTAPSKGKGVLQYIDDTVRSLASGITFGFADEIAAAADTALGTGAGKPTYEENLAAQQQRDKEIPAGIKIPGEVAGAVAGTIAAAPVRAPLMAVSGAERLPALVRTVGGGATGGALFGAGEAEPGQRLEGAGKGAVIGGVAGAAVPPVVGGIARLGSEIRGALSPQANVAADLSRAITRDETTPAELLQRAQEAQTIRPGVATLADVGGENVRGLVERIAQTPGAGRTQVVPALTQRQQGQLARVATDLRELTGTHKSATQAINETMAERKAAATPLYNAAYTAGDRAIWSPELERLSSAPSVLSALRSAQSKWKDWQVVDGFGAANPPIQIERGGLLKFTGGGGVPTYPNLQFWDYAARELRDKASEAYKAGRGELYRRYSGLERNLTAELDRIVPDYAAARSAWAGPSRYLDAIEEGRNIFGTKISAEELRAALGAMTESEREGFRIGAVTAAVTKMGRDPAKLGDMTKYLRSPEARAKIAALMPTPQAQRAWQQRLDFEIRSSELTGRALGNSATARRLAEQSDAGSIAGDLVMDAFMGHPPISLLRRAIGAVPSKIRDTLRSRSDDILAELLTDPNSMAGLRQAIERVEAAGQPRSLLRAPAAVRGATAGATAEGQ